MTEKKWSKYQKAIFENVATGTGHTVVKAVAGSGKTSSIVEAMKYIPGGLSTLFVAFNKGIAEELKKRAPRGVEVSTLHSYGLKTITRTLGRLRIDDRRSYTLIREMSLEVSSVIAKIEKSLKREPSVGLNYDLQRDLVKAVSLAKGSLFIEESQIDEIIDSFDIESPKRSPVEGVTLLPEAMQTEFRQAFTKDVISILMRCADTSDGTIDFDDMIWLPVALDLRQAKFDRVFVDETQDLNPSQIEMTMRAVKANGRICAVGDPRQAIYGFRGADSAAVDNIVKRLEATVLPLSVCYRCCKKIVVKAKEVVPEIEFSPDAEDGLVLEADISELKSRSGAQPGDFVLSRTNAPLISLCMHFLKEGRPATIQGRDIGASLAAFVRKSAANTVSALCNYVEEWRDVESKRLAEKRRDTQAVEDRADCILALADGARTVADVISRIESLFEDKNDTNRIVLSSTHKAKGMERERVWMLADTYRRRPSDEETCLYYVAVTRAQKILILVYGKQ